MASSRQRRKELAHLDPHTRERVMKMDPQLMGQYKIKRAIMAAATGVIERDEMVKRLQDIYRKHPYRASWNELNLAWQTNWISADEYQQILDNY